MQESELKKAIIHYLEVKKSGLSISDLRTKIKKYTCFQIQKEIDLMIKKGELKKEFKKYVPFHIVFNGPSIYSFRSVYVLLDKKNKT